MSSTAARGDNLMTVHVVDDDRDVRHALAFLLRAQDYAAAVYASGEAFLSALPALVPGCILLDLHLAGVTGLQLLARMRSLGVHWPVILMTGHGGGPARQQALDLGAIGFLEKPFDDARLHEALRRGFASLPPAAQA